MHNRIGFNRLGRKSSHRKALHRNMVTSLIKHERIETTQAKAKEIRRAAEKLVTRAKVDSVHNRRIAARFVYEGDMVNKLFTEIGPRFVQRPGGYTRILKLGRRGGDGAELVILEFLPENQDATSSKKGTKGQKKSSGSKKASAPASSASAKAAVEKSKPADVDAPSGDEAPTVAADAVIADEAAGADDAAVSSEPTDEKVDSDATEKPAEQDSEDKT